MQWNLLIMFFWQWMGKQPPKRKRSFLHLQVHFRCKRNPGILGPFSTWTISTTLLLEISTVPGRRLHLKMIFLFFLGRVRPNESCEGYVTNILAKQSCFANRNSVYIGCFVDGAFGSPVLVDHNKLHPVPPTTLGSLVATFPFPQILEMIADSITREQENKIQSIMTIPGPKYIYIISNELMNLLNMTSSPPMSTANEPVA